MADAHELEHVVQFHVVRVLGPVHPDDARGGNGEVRVVERASREGRAEDSTPCRRRRPRRTSARRPRGTRGRRRNTPRLARWRVVVVVVMVGAIVVGGDGSLDWRRSFRHHRRRGPSRARLLALAAPRPGRGAQRAPAPAPSRRRTRALAEEGHAVQDASLPDLAVARSFAVVHRAEVLGVLGRAPASARARVAVRADVILRIVHVLHHASEAHERAGGDVVHAHGVDLGDARHDAGTRERLVEARSNAPVGVLGGRAGGCGGVEEFGHRPEGIQHALRERGRHRECFGERGCARATLDLAGRATPTAVLFEDARARTARSCPPGIRSAACLAFAPDELYLLKWWWARPRGARRHTRARLTRPPAGCDMRPGTRDSVGDVRTRARRPRARAHHTAPAG